MEREGGTSHAPLCSEMLPAPMLVVRRSRNAKLHQKRAKNKMDVVEMGICICMSVLGAFRARLPCRSCWGLEMVARARSASLGRSTWPLESDRFAGALEMANRACLASLGPWQWPTLGFAGAVEAAAQACLASLKRSN